MKNKFLLFTDYEQPLVMEVIGYAITILAGFTHWALSRHRSWSEYVYTVLITVLVGCTYRLLVRHHKEVGEWLRKIYEVITNILVRFAGKDPQALSKVERIRAGVIGASLFVPCIMSFITIPYILQTCFDVRPLYASLFTIIPATIIFLVDRTLVATMGWKKNWGSFMIRFLVALPLGYFLALPIELKFFDKETTEELTVQKQEKLKSIEAERLESHTEIDQKEKLAGAERDRARQAYEDEVNNSIGGRRAGHGVEAKKKEQYFNEEEAKLQKLAPKYQQEHRYTDSLYDARKAEYSAVQSYGIGARIQALQRAGEKYTSIWLFGWIITLFLLGLDLSPLIAKFMMSKQLSERDEELQDDKSTHVLRKQQIVNKHDLYREELTKNVEMLEKLDLPKDIKRAMKKQLHRKLTYKYFGYDIVSKAS